MTMADLCGIRNQDAGGPELGPPASKVDARRTPDDQTLRPPPTSGKRQRAVTRNPTEHLNRTPDGRSQLTMADLRGIKTGAAVMRSSVHEPLKSTRGRPLMTGLSDLR